MNFSRDDQVFAEKLAMFYRNNLLSVTANFLIAILMVVALRERLVESTANFWLLLTVIKLSTSVAGIIGYKRWSREVARRGASATRPELDRWARYAWLNSMGAGILWGVAALWLIPHDQFAQFFFLFVVTGIISGSVSAMSPYLPSLYVFLVPVLLAISSSMLLQGERWETFAAMMTALYLVMMVSFGRSINKTLTDALQLRFQNIALLDDLRLQKNQADAANIDKSRFLAAASHDLRQPLHALNLFTESLRARPLDAESQALVGNIGTSLDAMDSLFNGLLDISRLDAGVIQPTTEHFALDALFERLRVEYQPQALAQGLTLRIRPTDVLVKTDPALLDRILRNLIANALRYTTHGGVLVAARPAGSGHYRLQVWDSGIGIPDDRRTEIFQEFVQLHNPERDRSKGMGLGLAIVKRLAVLLQLPLRMQSVVDRGSMFEIIVATGDMNQLAPVQAQRTVEANQPTGGLVLVIDDEAAIRDGMRVMLELWGYTTLCAGSLAELTPKLAACKQVPVLILSDYRLRDGESGADAIEQLQADYNDEIPAILITGDTAPDRLIEAQQSGYAILHKPVQPARLRALVNQLIAA